MVVVEVRDEQEVHLVARKCAENAQHRGSQARVGRNLLRTAIVEKGERFFTLVACDKKK